jgi:DNA-binding transcriptional regulator YhcF (GntR family)
VKLYERLVGEIEGMVARGVLKPGERVLSVRRTSEQYNLSITTVVRAFLLLKSRGVIESRPQSGYFVSHGAQGGGGGSETEQSTAVSIGSTDTTNATVSTTTTGSNSTHANSVDSSVRQTSPDGVSNVSSANAGVRRIACSVEPARRTTGAQLDPRLIASAAACDPFARAIRLPAVRALFTALDV